MHKSGSRDWLSGGDEIASPEIVHKSDAGGVKIGLKNEDEVRQAFRAIINNAKKYKPDAKIDGVLYKK